MTTVAETVPAVAGVNARGRSENPARFYRPELDVLRFLLFSACSSSMRLRAVWIFTTALDIRRG
jgi:hypothetical protein